MPDQTHTFGGGIAETTISPVALVAILIGVALVLLLPRRYAIIPVMLCVVLIPLGQAVYALGAHWLPSRIILLAGIARVVIIRFTSGRLVLAGGRTSVDYALTGTVLCQIVAFSLLYMDPAALVNQLGFLIDFLGAWLVLRTLIQDEGDVYRLLKWLSFVTLLLAFGMALEQATSRNLFATLGGVSLVPEVRGGRIRSQAAFQHALTAGTFGAVLVPLFVLLWRNGRARIAAAVGLIACTTMMICSNSSTPLLAYAAGVLAICIWPLRGRMQMLRRGLVMTLVALHLVMKAPVWFLIARVDLTGSSSGYHRAQLADQAIRHFGDWWLLGAKDAAGWGWDMWDTQNQFVTVATGGGLLALVCFIGLISRTFARLGRARKAAVGKGRKEWAPWLLGCSVFAWIVAFFGINYFDQSKFCWLMLLAMALVIGAPGAGRRASRSASAVPGSVSPVEVGAPGAGALS